MHKKESGIMNSYKDFLTFLESLNYKPKLLLDRKYIDIL